MEWPLSGLRVADLSAGIAGGYCTKVLADGGAEVIKLEPPGARIVAHERGDAGGLRVPGREQLGVRAGGRRPPAVGSRVRRVDVAVEGVGRGRDERAQHVAHRQARRGRYWPGHFGRRAPGEQAANALPGGEPDLAVVTADLSADNHATNLAIG